MPWHGRIPVPAQQGLCPRSTGKTWLWRLQRRQFETPGTPVVPQWPLHFDLTFHTCIHGSEPHLFTILARVLHTATSRKSAHQALPRALPCKPQPMAAARDWDWAVRTQRPLPWHQAARQQHPRTGCPLLPSPLSLSLPHLAERSHPIAVTTLTIALSSCCLSAGTTAIAWEWS